MMHGWPSAQKLLRRRKLNSTLIYARVHDRTVVVTGQLVSRDRKVPLSEFVERAKDGSGLSDAEKATLVALADKIGQEPRAVTEIVVQELVYL